MNKYLSMSSSPTKNYIEVTKRISDSQFSKKLLSLKVGEEVSFNLPLGECVFKNEYKVSKFYLFGSYVRGEADSKSDIDLLVDLDYSQRTSFVLS